MRQPGIILYILKIQDARDGKFEGAVIPPDLQRQWIQATGPAAKPNARVESSIRNVANALLLTASSTNNSLDN